VGQKRGCQARTKARGRRSRCPTGASSAVRIAALFCAYGRVPLGCIGACPPPRPTRRRGSAEVSVSGTRTPAPAEGSGGNGAPWPAATRPEGWQNTVREKTRHLFHVFRVFTLACTAVLSSLRRCADDSTRPRSWRSSWRFSSPRRARRRITRIPLAYPWGSMRMLKLPGTRTRT
jgi:hypothetical protein